jgi:glutathione S-transferase
LAAIRVARVLVPWWGRGQRIFAVRLGIFAAFANEDYVQFIQYNDREIGGMMSLIVYERVGHNGCQPSPFSWRTRYALAHKELDAEYWPTRFCDVETIQKLSGQRLVPILIDGHTVVNDSWNIATYLEERFPDRPSLFGDSASRAVTRLVNHWADTTFHLPLRMLIFPDFIGCLCPEDRDYFLRSREKEFGMTVEQVRGQGARWRKEFETACLPLERLLGEQEFIRGHSPRYADYIVFSNFLQAHACGHTDLLRPGSPIARWRMRMFDAFETLPGTLLAESILSSCMPVDVGATVTGNEIDKARGAVTTRAPDHRE